MQVPSEDVTTVRPLEVDVDMLVEPDPGFAWVATVGPDGPVVEPDTLPPPAVTCELMPPAEDSLGGFSPRFRCTVLQLLLGPEDERTSPFEDVELDELEVSAWAAKAAAPANASAQTIELFMAILQGERLAA